MPSQIIKGFVLAVVAAILWGVSGTFAQFLFQQREINVEWLITVRLLVSGSILLLFAKFGEKGDLCQFGKTRKTPFSWLFLALQECWRCNTPISRQSIIPMRPPPLFYNTLVRF